jgi:GDP-L-fucose synthase
MRKDARIFVAGSQTLIGAALLRELTRLGFSYLCGLPHREPDLSRPDDVLECFARHQPDYVFVAGGSSGGIAANQRRPAELMRDNLLTTVNVLEAAHQHGVAKLLYLASSCSYPRDCPQPMQENRLMTGPLEPTSAAYATAKLAGIQLCHAYRRQYGVNFVVGIPATAFGPGDDFSAEDSHVVGALIRRMHEARASGRDNVTVWGTGRPRRELLFAQDLADACLHVMRTYEEPEPINLGTGEDLSIRELAELVREVVGFEGRIEFDLSRPDGAPRKALDGGKLARLGWQPTTPLREALAATYQAFLHTTQSLEIAHA